MSRKKINPRRRPLTEADIKRAKGSAMSEAMKRTIYLMIYILLDKHEASKEDLKQFAEEINYYADSIREGRITWKDLEHVVREEYEIELPW